MTLRAMYHPTGKPNRMQKIGTPMPSPTQTRSRKANGRRPVGPPVWGGQKVRLLIEEDVAFTRDGCRVIGDRRTAFHLV
ncbi:MAG: hypothetical protein NTU94_12170 [Planctomycetota bacterium]|nr:hypothetical protein [Planctomycetota bacterium]